MYSNDHTNAVGSFGLSKRLFVAPQSDWPNRLRDAGPRVLVPVDWRVLFALLLLCLLPRLLTAVRQPCLFGDSEAYLRINNELAQGRFDSLMGVLNVNCYPVILRTFSLLGLDVVLAGTIWSIACATLVVLPLYGWTRRMFNEQIAILACMLYALQEALTGDSTLLGRDPTFWLLMTCTIYLTWRALTEQRWWLYLAAGFAFTFSAYTRDEGWLLGVPIAVWLVARWFYQPPQRRRMLCGMLLFLLTVPVFLVSYNLTMLQGHDQWEWGRTARFERLFHTIARYFEDAPVENSPVNTIQQGTISGSNVLELETVVAEDTTAPAQPKQMTELLLLRKHAVRFVKAIGYVFFVLLVIGIFTLRRYWLRPDHFGIYLYALMNLVGIWIVWRTAIDRRYFMPMTILCMPIMACGFVRLGQFAHRLVTRWFEKRGKCYVDWDISFRRFTIGMLIVLATMIVINPRKFRELQLADLGRWIHANSTVEPSLLYNAGYAQPTYLGYYTQGPVKRYFSPDDFRAMLNRISHDEKTRPEFVVFWRSQPKPFQVADRSSADFTPYQPLFVELTHYGYREVPRKELPETCGRFVVYQMMKSE